MSDLPTCDCYETYPGPGTHREGCNVRNEIKRLEAELSVWRPDTTNEGHGCPACGRAYDLETKLQSKVAELEGALREIVKRQDPMGGEAYIAKQALKD